MLYDAHHPRALSSSLFEAFVFLDDNPMELEAVRRELPEVITVAVPSGDRLDALLRSHWALDLWGSATWEDAQRTQMPPGQAYI